MNEAILFITILLPIVAGMFIFVRRPKDSRLFSFITAAVTGLCALGVCTLGGRFEYVFGPSLSLRLEADALSTFFLVLIASAFALVILYAKEYFDGDKNSYKFFGFTLMTLGAMLGLSMAGNIITFYMFYEMMSLLSFPLVLYNGDEKARHAAMVYLGFSVFGASMALMGIMLGGDITLKAFSNVIFNRPLSSRLLSAYLLMAIGFSCKAGMVPLANWLPTAHPVAPAPASALLSGIITKAGILGIIRTTFYLFGGSNLQGTFPQTVMLILSMTTIFMGSMLAYKERLLKKRLAFSSVSQLSYVIFGLMLMTPEGMCAGLMQVLFHACAKVGLFLCAGAFIHRCGAHYVDELRGMGRRMPWVMAAFTCCSLSLIGLPPFGGFISKWKLALAALSQGSRLAGIGVIMLMVSAFLTAGYLLPVVSNGYFPGRDFKAQKSDAGIAMILPLVLLAAVSAVLGMFPEGLVTFFRTFTVNIF